MPTPQFSRWVEAGAENSAPASAGGATGARLVGIVEVIDEGKADAATVGVRRAASVADVGNTMRPFSSGPGAGETITGPYGTGSIIVTGSGSTMPSLSTRRSIVVGGGPRNTATPGASAPIWYSCAPLASVPIMCTRT